MHQKLGRYRLKAILIGLTLSFNSSVANSSTAPHFQSDLILFEHQYYATQTAILNKLKFIAEHRDTLDLMVQQVFGHDIQQADINLFRQKIISNKIRAELPKLELSISLNDDTLGAFSAATNTIYLNESLIRSTNPQNVIIEELGHWIDSQLRPDGSDASGDEGELFRRVITNSPHVTIEQIKLDFPNLYRENDYAQLDNGLKIEQTRTCRRKPRANNAADLNDEQFEDLLAYLDQGCFDGEDDNTSGAKQTKKRQRVKNANDLYNKVKKGKYSDAEVRRINGSLETAIQQGIDATPPELILGIPKKAGKPQESVVFKFPANDTVKDHFADLSEQWENAKNAKQSAEVLGEIVSTQAILKEDPNASLVWGFESKSATGIDQVWKMNGGNDYVAVEAKGGTSGLSSDKANNGLFDQMSKDWFVDRLVRERNEYTLPKAQQVLTELGIDYQGYGFYKKNESGNWVVNGKENYVVSGRQHTTTGIRAAVIRDKYTGKGNMFAYDTGYHSSQSSSPFNLVPESWVTKDLHIPDHQLGSLHQMLMDSSETYKAAVTKTMSDGRVEISLSTGNNPNDRVSIWNPHNRSIEINKHGLSPENLGSRSFYGPKIAGELSLEMANASLTDEFMQVALKARNGKYKNAAEYAKAVLEIEHKAVLNVQKIEGELVESGLFEATGALKDVKRFNQLDASEDFDVWYEKQKLPRGSKKSLEELYRDQYQAVKQGHDAHIIRKPNTSITAELQELRANSEYLDPDLLDDVTGAMDTSNARAHEYYEKFVTAVEEQRWDDARFYRHQADYLYAHQKHTYDAIVDNPNVDAATLGRFEQQINALRETSQAIYEDLIVPTAENHVAEAIKAKQEVEISLNKAHEARNASDFIEAKKQFDIAAQTQGKHEGLLASADKLSAELVSAKKTGIINDTFLANSSYDWNSVSAADDFDRTSRNRPKFINDAVSDARVSRRSVTEGVLDIFNDELGIVKDQVDNLSSLSEEAKVERLAEIVGIYQDANRAVAQLESSSANSDAIFSNKINNIKDSITSINTSLGQAGVEYGDSVTESVHEQFVEAAKTDSKLAGMLGKDGKVHTAFKYGGKVMLVVGVLSDGYKIYTANDTLGAVVEVAGGWGGAAAGAGLAEAYVAPYASWFGPIGWAVDGAVGFAGGLGGYWVGSKAAGGLYSVLKPHHDTNDPLTSIQSVVGDELSILKDFDHSIFPYIDRVSLLNINTKVWAENGEVWKTGAVLVGLVDNHGNPLKDVKVRVYVLRGRSSISPVSGFTDANGNFRAAVRRKSGSWTIDYGAEYDSNGDGTPDTPLINGNPTSIRFGIGG